MAYRIHTETRPNSFGLDPTVWVLEDGADSGIEVWPALGFHCYRWFVNLPKFGTQELLFAVPEYFQQQKPTRSGIPMLFPFPNRIRDGRFHWRGADYQLERNDPSGKNAIHGFACHFPWNVIDHGTAGDAAWITGEFSAQRGVGVQGNWPAAYRVRLTYRLTRQRLRLEANVHNPDDRPLPFGLGYHPYFPAQLLGDADSVAEVSAGGYWELVENLPTGKILPAAGQRDLRRGQKISTLQLDDVFTELETPAGRDLVRRGAVRSPANQAALEVWTSPNFREMVVFTPPHRKAICLEPYTCPTDAIHLQERGQEVGSLVLEPGRSWTGIVELVLKT